MTSHMHPGTSCSSSYCNKLHLCRFGFKDMLLWQQLQIHFNPSLKHIKNCVRLVSNPQQSNQSNSVICILRAGPCTESRCLLFQCWNRLQMRLQHLHKSWQVIVSFTQNVLFFRFFSNCLTYTSAQFTSAGCNAPQPSVACLLDLKWVLKTYSKCPLVIPHAPDVP